MLKRDKGRRSYRKRSLARFWYKGIIKSRPINQTGILAMTEDQKILVTTHLKNILSGKVIPKNGLCIYFSFEIEIEKESLLELKAIISLFNESCHPIYIIEGSCTFYTKAITECTLYNPNYPNGARRLRLVQHVLNQLEKGI